MNRWLWGFIAAWAYDLGKQLAIKGQYKSTEKLLKQQKRLCTGSGICIIINNGNLNSLLLLKSFPCGWTAETSLKIQCHMGDSGSNLERERKETKKSKLDWLAQLCFVEKKTPPSCWCFYMLAMLKKKEQLNISV